MKKPTFLLMALGALSAIPLPCTSPARADAATDAWFQSAVEYLKTPPSGGKSPAIYATISLVSTEPGSALVGRKPDRTALWYASGELAYKPFPVITYFEGKLPLWINSGDANAPFNSKNTTLGIVVQNDGTASLHYQVDGRNRLGRGPQSIKMGAVASGSDKDTQMFSAATSFFGSKLIVLALTKGEKVGPPTMTPPSMPTPLTVPTPKPVGARYRVTPSFLVTNSNDGIGDNTVEMWGVVGFHSAGKNFPQLNPKGASRGKGGRVQGTPFEMETRFDNPASLRLKFDGNIYDADLFNKTDDEMWRRAMSISLQGTAESKDKTARIPPERAYQDDEAQGILEIKVEKIADVF